LSLYIPLDSNDLITWTPIKKNQLKGKPFERVINKKTRREIQNLQSMKSLTIISIKDSILKEKMEKKNHNENKRKKYEYTISRVKGDKWVI